MSGKFYKIIRPNTNTEFDQEPAATRQQEEVAQDHQDEQEQIEKDPLEDSFHPDVDDHQEETYQDGDDQQEETVNQDVDDRWSLVPKKKKPGNPFQSR